MEEVNNLDVFDVEDNGINGVNICVLRIPLIGNCKSVEEIDTSIRLLMQNLDAVSIKMKQKLSENTTKPIFLTS